MGIRGETVTDVSQRLLAHHGGLRGLLRLEVAELARVRGPGDAKAVRVKAALELGRRLAALSPEERPPVGSPEDVANLPGIEMAALEQEQQRVVLLDTKHCILGTRTVYQGSVNQAQGWVAGSCRGRLSLHEEQDVTNGYGNADASSLRIIIRRGGVTRNTTR